MSHLLFHFTTTIPIDSVSQMMALSLPGSRLVLESSSCFAMISVTTREGDLYRGEGSI